jgi:hypothetical protein
MFSSKRCAEDRKSMDMPSGHDNRGSATLESAGLVAAWSPKRLSIVLVAYTLGFLAVTLFGMLLKHGLETSARELLPFHLAFDFVFGLVVGGVWLLVLPTFYYFGFELVVSLLKGGSGTATFDRAEFALLGTLFIVLGFGGNALWRRLHVRDG